MNTAFQNVYTKITQITKATCSLKAQGVGNDELAIVNGRLAQVVKIWGEDITLQVFSGTEGIPTNAEVTFLGKSSYTEGRRGSVRTFFQCIRRSDRGRACCRWRRT